MIRRSDRRDFVKWTASTWGALSTVSLPSILIGGCKTPGSTTLESDVKRVSVPATGFPRRKEVNEDAENAQKYAKAFRLLQTDPDLKANDIWNKFASIHNNFCPHGNWFFLPWHRVYVSSFEKMIRDVLQDETFALPYWDWTKNPGLPNVAMQESGIYREGRSQEASGGGTIGVEYTGQAVIDRAMDSQDFDAFGSGRTTKPRGGQGPGGQGILEATPHNMIHVWVGGIMQSFMSPLDPVFWLHHCNIDRLWAVWQMKMRNGKRNDFPRDKIVGPDVKAEDFLFYDLNQDMRRFDPATKDVVDGTDRVNMYVTDTFETHNFGYVFDEVGTLPPLPMGSRRRFSLAGPTSGEQSTGGGWQPAFEARIAVKPKHVFTFSGEDGVQSVTFAVPTEQKVGTSSTGGSVTLADVIERFNSRNDQGQTALTMGVRGIPRIDQDLGAPFSIFVNWKDKRMPTGADYQRNFLGLFTFFVDPSHMDHMEPTANLLLDLGQTLKSSDLEVSPEGNLFFSVFIRTEADLVGIKERLRNIDLDISYFEA